MSGLEIAGVVLGALPLVISALEHYAKGVEGVIRYYKYRVHLQTLIDAVKTQKVIFSDTLEQLLTGIVRIDEMAAFIANPAGRPDVDLRLKRRLRDGYEAYFANVRGMETALLAMMEKLKLGVDGKPQFSDPGFFKQEYRRLKFSISKSAYDDQLRELRHYNDSLSQLTGKSLTLEPSRRRSRPNFKVVQDYAKSMFHTLRSSLQCACQNHAVNLRLENRSKLSSQELPEAPYAPFRFIFTNSVNASTQLPASWKEVEVRHFEDPVMQPPQLAAKLPRSCNTRDTKRKVRFGVIEMQHVQIHPGHEVRATAGVQVAPPKATPSQQIKNLCVAIAQVPTQHNECVGYLIDDAQQKHGMYWRSSSCEQQQWTRCTLDQVLSGAANHTVPLSLRDKFRVAVDLASGVLQLHKTPWLSEDWKQSDVVFIHRPEAARPSMYEHPYVYREMSQKAPPQQNGTTPSSFYRVIRNRTLYTLGIVLIELCYGKLMQGLQKAEDLQCDGTPGVEWCTADRLIRTKDIDNHVGKRYADAVRRCVYCDFGVDDADLDDEKFQQVVYEGVLEKLEESLQHIEG